MYVVLPYNNFALHAYAIWICLNSCSPSPPQCTPPTMLCVSLVDMSIKVLFNSKRCVYTCILHQPKGVTRNIISTAAPPRRKRLWCLPIILQKGQGAHTAGYKQVRGTPETIASNNACNFRNIQLHDYRQKAFEKLELATKAWQGSWDVYTH